MTTPTILPAGYAGDSTDFNKVKRDTFGAVRQVSGAVTVPNSTAVGAFVGLVPFQKGARFIINDKSVHITDIDAGTDSTVNLGIVYDDNTTFTNDVDAFVSASTAGQAGGFLAIDEVEGLTLVTEGNGWLALENEANITEAEGTVTFTVGVVYD
jgi:hypothetical protein